MKKSSFGAFVFLLAALFFSIPSQPVFAQQNCPTACIDINSSCPNGTTRNTQRVCGSSTLQCCTATASTGTNTNTGTNASNTSNSSSAVNISLSNPLRYNTVEGVLTSIMSAIRTIVATLAILMIVIGGIMYIFSLGNADKMKTAKNVILAALVGLAIVLAAPAFLKEVYSLLGAGPAPSELSGALTLTQIATNILNFLLSIIGILALITLIISGIMYLTSAGNDTRMKQAKSIFIAALIGIAVAMGSLVLVRAVASFFIT